MTTPTEPAMNSTPFSDPVGAPEEAAVPTQAPHAGEWTFKRHDDGSVWVQSPSGDSKALRADPFLPASPAVAVPGEGKSLSEHELEKTANGQQLEPKPEGESHRG